MTYAYTLPGGTELTGNVDTKNLYIDGVLTIDSNRNLYIAGITSTSDTAYADDVKATFGNSSDLQIWHQSSNGNSIIKDNGPGSLSLQSNGTYINLWDSTNAQHMLIANTGGAVELYHGSDGLVRLETDALGVDITGDADVSNDLNVGGNATITGNLTVNGTTTTLNTETITAEDAVILLNSGQATPANDIGLVFQRYSTATSTNYNPVFIWEETTDRFILGATAEAGADANISLTSQWFTVAGSGDVGINTAPDTIAKFQIARSATSEPNAGGNNQAFISLDNTDTTANSKNLILFRANDSGGSIRHGAAIQFAKENAWTSNDYAGQLSFWTRPSGGNQVQRMTIDSNGWVGIGSTNPQALIDVRYSLNTATDYWTNGQAGLFVYNTNAAGDAMIKMVGGTSVQRIVYGTGAGTDKLIFSSRTSEDTTSQHVTFDDDGNVGIGVSTPSNQLHVKGQGILKLERDNDDTKIYFENGANNNTWAMGMDYSNSEAFALSYAVGGDASLSTSPALVVETNGSVGIGTTNPIFELDVVGQIWARGNTAGDDDIMYLGTLDDNAATAFATIKVDDPTGDSLITRINRWGSTHTFSRGSQAGSDIPVVDFNSSNGQSRLSIYNQNDPVNSTAVSENVRLHTAGESWLTGGNVGVGTTNPDNLFHVYEGNSGGAPNTNAQLVVEDSSTAGVAIQTGNTGSGYVWFGDASDNASARMRYDHATDTFTWRVGGVDDVLTLSTQKLTIDHTLAITTGTAESYSFEPGRRAINFDPVGSGVDGTADLPLAWTGNEYLAASETYATASFSQTFTVTSVTGARWFVKVKTNDAQTVNGTTLSVNDGTKYTLDYTDANPNGIDESDMWHVFDVTDDVVTGTNTVKVYLTAGQKTTLHALYVFPSTGIALPNEPGETVQYSYDGYGVGDSVVIDKSRNITGTNITADQYHLNGTSVYTSEDWSDGAGNYTDDDAWNFNASDGRKILGVNNPASANQVGLTYGPQEGGTYSSRYWLLFDTTNNASKPQLTNRTPAGPVEIWSGTTAGGGEIKRLTVQGGDNRQNIDINNADLRIFGSNTQDVILRMDATTADKTDWRMRVTNDTGVDGKFIIEDYAGASWSSNLTVTSSGYVGIGTTSPNNLLHVYQNGSLDVIMEGGANSRAQIQYKNDAQQYNVGINGSDNFVIFDSTNSTERVTITPSGKVGIGSATPSALLEVTGNVNDNWAGRFENTNSGGYGILGVTAGTAEADKVFELRKGTSTTVMQVNGNGDIDFMGIDGGTNGLGNLQRISSAYFVNNEDDYISTTLSQTNGARLYYDHNWYTDQTRFSSVFSGDGGGFAYYGGDQMNWTAIYDSENTQYAEGTWRKLNINNGTTDDRALVITNTMNDPENEDFQFSVEISTTTSGSGALTADRERGAIWIDLNDSTTGGDTTNESRIYGMYVDVDGSGDSDMLAGVYTQVTSNMNSASDIVTNLWGHYALAEADQASGTISNLIGMYGQASIDNAGGSANNAWGLRGIVSQQPDGESISDARGVEGELYVTNTTAGNDITTGYAVKATVDNNSGRTDVIGTSYLFHGSYEGVLPTTARGLWIPTSGTSNYLGGNLGIGAAPASTQTLYVEGSSGITEVTINSSDANPDLLFQEAGADKARIMWDRNNPSLIFHVDDGTLGNDEYTLVLRNGGNIGIGNSTPGHRLTIGSDTITTAKATVQVTDLSNGASLALRGLQPSLIFDQSSGNIPTIYMDGVGLRFLNCDFDGTSPEAMRIDASNNVGIGTTTPGYKLEVNGSFAATTKSFVIDHPTKEGMKLRHGSLEGPEDGVYVRGKLDGTSVIELPDYWTGLVHEDTITVQLTAIGGQQDLWIEDIVDNKIYVGSDSRPVKCFYFVQAERKDVDRWDTEFDA